MAQQTNATTTWAMTVADKNATMGGFQNAIQQARGKDSQVPNLETLFGSLSFCDCQHCRSFYGPAAYFVDLLQFLRRSKDNDAGKSPLDVLLARQPDLEYMKLNCENTNTPLPYVDLVNEILEAYVALGHLDASAAHDTGDTTADELSANPQYINDSAYLKLMDSKTVYPFTLPFNRPLEVVRTYLQHLGASRDQVMKTFQVNGNPSDLAIACERLKISPEEYVILTQASANLDGTAVTPSLLREYYGYTQDTVTVPDPQKPKEDITISWTDFLSQVPELLRCTGVSYVDLAALVTTHFLNPSQAIRLDTPSFIPDPDDPTKQKSVDPCDLTLTVITNLDVATLQKLYRFIRLWKKIGWQIAELDKAIRALGANDIDGALLVKLAHVRQLQTDLKLPWNQLLAFWAQIDAEGRNSLYINLFQNKAVLKPVDPDFELRYVAPLGSLPAITLSSSPTARISYDSGKKELRLVGGITADEQDLLLSLSADPHYRAAIDHVYQKQIGEISAQMGSLPTLTVPNSWTDRFSYDAAARQLEFIGSMTADERTLLLSFSTDTSYRLAIDNLFQMRWFKAPEIALLKSHPKAATIPSHAATILAALRISAVDLAAVTANPGGEVTDGALKLGNLSKLYRFAILARALKLSVNDLISLKALSAIDPFQPGVPASTVSFVEMANRVRRSRFSVAQLNYLYRHAYDPSRGIAPIQANVDLLLNNLRTGLKKISDDTTLVSDPTGDLLRQNLAVVLDSALIDPAIGLLDGSTIYSAPLTSLPSMTFPDPLNARITYKGKTLRFTGAMTDADRTTLLSLSLDVAYQATIKELFQQPRDFITKNLGLFLLNPSDAVLQLITNPQGLTTAEKFGYVLAPLMAYLRETQSGSVIKQTLSDNLKLDSAIADLLLSTRLKSQTDTTKPAITDFLALADGGLSASYFATADLTGPAIRRTDPLVHFDWSAISPDPGINLPSFSVQWTGRLLAHYSETYTFYTGANDGVRLWIDDQLLIDQWHDQAPTEYSATIDLKAGQVYGIRMEHYNKSVPASANLLWSGPSTPKAAIPALATYPACGFASFSLLHKVAMLLNAFKMTAEELDYFSEHSADFEGVDPADPMNTDPFDLNALPLDPSGFRPALFNQWERLSDLFTLRDTLPQGEIGLLDVFGASSVDGAQSNLALATGWNAAELGALTGSTIDPVTSVHIGFNLAAGDLKNGIKLLSLQVCWALMKRLGVSTKQLFNWASTEPSSIQAQEIKNTARAKYNNETWLTIAKPLNDLLRESQRKALVAYLLTVLGFNDSSELYEYFLIDVDMSPCMMTSRIVQANSAIQIFVQRCLMNLEDGKVSPSAIDADQWHNWRKRYRFWEANRKVFLYPENWIVPELRDDKSPFFKEMERELLQNDVTRDTVEQAFLNYLEKLDEVARLDIRGMCLQDISGNGMSDAVHVFGRTFNVPPIYYYRRLSVLTNVWTPWEKVNLDIQGDHLIPLIYNGRLYLFWPIFESKPDEDQPEIESKEHKQWTKQNEAYRKYQQLYNVWLNKRKWVDDPTKKDNSDIILHHWHWDPDAPQSVNPPSQEPPYANSNEQGLPAVSHWEIKMAWSEYKQTKWTAKQTSRDPIIISSEQGNPKHTGDPPTWTLPEQSSFTFAVSYPDGILNIDVNRAFKNSSTPEVVTRHGIFWMDGCRSKLQRYWNPNDMPSEKYITPSETEIDFMAFNEINGTSGLAIETYPHGIKGARVEYHLLEKSPSLYSILYPLDRQPLGREFWLGDLYPFFYQDDQRTYFVSPEQVSLPSEALTFADKAGPAYKSMDLASKASLTLPENGDPPIFGAEGSLVT